MGSAQVVHNNVYMITTQEKMSDAVHNHSVSSLRLGTSFVLNRLLSANANTCDSANNVASGRLLMEMSTPSWMKQVLRRRSHKENPVSENLG